MDPIPRKLGRKHVWVEEMTKANPDYWDYVRIRLGLKDPGSVAPTKKGRKSPDLPPNILPQEVADQIEEATRTGRPIIFNNSEHLKEQERFYDTIRTPGVDKPGEVKRKRYTIKPIYDPRHTNKP